ncbi:anti-sigma factor [Cohnella hongkongensis]|uniref:Anti-sigma factor n=1 Tax=Cohnella hongkongensis TaxID=178337 RepID=A0ABV9FH19_9BACL
MLGRDCGIPDERWIDYHLGNLGKVSSEALERHAENCSVCRIASNEWADLLGVTAGRNEGVREAAPEGGSQRPFPGVYRSLRRQTAVRLLWRKAKRRPAVGAAFCAALLAAALIGLLKSAAVHDVPKTAAPLEAQHYAALHEPNGARLMELPGTRVISSSEVAVWPAVTPSFVPGRSLTVWINADTEELFVLLEGVLESEASDMQAWADSSSRTSNLGLLKFHSGQGHLYSRFREMAALEALRITIEPKGGSERPTNPVSAHVRLASE